MMVVIGSLAVVVLSLLIMWVYVKNANYGLGLLALTISFIAITTYLSISEPTREEKLKKQLQSSEIELSQQTLEKSYGSHYLFTATAVNKSQQYRLTSLDLELILETSNESSNKNTLSLLKTIKINLPPQGKKEFQVYFESDSLSTEITSQAWKVLILSLRSK